MRSRELAAWIAALSVSTKLFFALLTVSVAVALAAGVGARLSFDEGFLGYLNDQAREQTIGLASRFGELYREHGSWQFMRDNADRFFNYVRTTHPGGPVTDKPIKPSTVVLTGLEYMLTLFDADGHRITGNPELENIRTRVPIRVDGRVVGTLGLQGFEHISEPAYLAFQHRHNQAIWVVTTAALLLAAATAFWLSRWLTRPLRRIASATTRLAHGDYRHRLAFRSRDEIGQLAFHFDGLADALEQNERMRRTFIADISHELRTPLAIMRGELEAVEDGVRAPTVATLRSLHTEVELMTKLVGDLYDLALSDVGALAYRKCPVDLGGVIADSLDAFHERFAARGLKLQVDLLEGVLVNADETRILQLFNNLLENSYRYTHDGGTVRVRLQADNDQALIDVDDSEPAVAQEQITRLFERFFRADSSRNRATGGAGLGLAICREIVAAHRGTISARHSLLGGLRINVALPLVGSESL